MNFTQLSPFGFLVQSTPTKPICKLAAQVVEDLVTEHGLLLLRGFTISNDTEFLSFSSQFGKLLEWDFGPILELKIDTTPKNHIFSSGRVELHWDGAFAEFEPRYNIFHCIEGSSENSGGETIFIDTHKVLNEAAPKDIRDWESIRIKYTTDKKAHYGGSIERSLVDIDLPSGPSLRYIEAFNEDNEEINPMSVEVVGMNSGRSDDFLRTMNQHLYQPSFKYSHTWLSGDILIADNSRLLHGRSRYLSKFDRRHIKRTNVR